MRSIQNYLANFDLLPARGIRAEVVNFEGIQSQPGVGNEAGFFRGIKQTQNETG